MEGFELMGKRVAKVAGIAAIVLVAAIAALFAWFVSDYYHATDQAQAALVKSDSISIEQLDRGSYALVPDGAKAGLVFYPGAKVDPVAYAPLMRQCANRGILCIVAAMPFNLALFDSNAAAGLMGKFPQIDSWYIGGHSLGGAMAASFADGHDGSLKGLVLLAAYPDCNLTDNDVRTLNIYGSEDGVLNRQRYEDGKAKLPDGAAEVVIEGGNHAGFGNYGDQAGDNAASISPEEQQRQTADAIAQLVAAS